MQYQFVLSGKERRRAFRRAAITRGDACHLCGRLGFVHEPNHAHEPVADHLIPRSFGGTSNEDNLALAHRSCNGNRGNALLPEVGTDHARARAYSLENRYPFNTNPPVSLEAEGG